MNPDANDNLSRGDTLPTMTQGGDLVGRRIKHELHKRTRRRRSAGERDKMEKAHTTTDETERTAWGASLPDDDEKAMDMIETYLPERTKRGRQILVAGDAPYTAMPPLVRCVLEFADDQQLMMCMKRIPGVPRERHLEEKRIARCCWV